MSKNSFAGTGRLLLLALKRDKIKLPVWILGITLMLISMAATYTGMLTQDNIIEMITLRAESPAIRAFDAPASGASLGSFTMLRVSGFIAIIIAVMSIQAIVRHTRQNEENGQSELIGSTVTGRYASLTAALILTVGANILLSVLSAFAFLMNGLPADGSFTAGAAFGATGIAFAGIAAVTAQLSQSSRGANGLGSIGLGVAFLLSSAGNMAGEFNPDTMEVESAWPVWLSPFGWYQQMRSFGQNNLWILLLFVIFFAAMTGLAFILNKRRDVGMGILPARRGPSEASASLLSPFGLAWRLQRSTFIAWLISLFVIGSVLGSVSGEFGKAVKDIEGADKIFGEINATEAFLGQIIGMIGACIVIYVVQSLLRMRGEEVNGTMEPVLATSVSRAKWMASHLLCCSLCTIISLLFLGLGAGIASTGEDGASVISMVEAALLQLPAIAVIAGLTIAAFGLLPRFTAALAWTGLAVSLITGPMFGPMMDLPEEIINISPFSHISTNISNVTAEPVIILLTIAVSLTVLGFMSFRHRNFII